MDTVNYNLTEKVVVVTGGSRGIGREVARMLLQEGARVVICGRKAEGLQKAAAELDGGDNLLSVTAHIAREEDVAALFEATLKRFGRLDALVNNVGMNIVSTVTDADLPLWQKIIDSNLTGAFLCARQAGRIMREAQKGKIVSISSLAAHRSAPALGIYGIAKAGIEMMTRVMAMELAPYNIQVNAVAPGMVRTDFSRPFWSNEELLDQIVKTIPLGRIAETGDVAHPTLFFCSAASNFITGQTLLVDGGASAV